MKRYLVALKFLGNYIHNASQILPSNVILTNWPVALFAGLYCNSSFGFSDRIAVHCARI